MLLIVSLAVNGPAALARQRGTDRSMCYKYQIGMGIMALATAAREKLFLSASK